MCQNAPEIRGQDPAPSQYQGVKRNAYIKEETPVAQKKDRFDDPLTLVKYINLKRMENSHAAPSLEEGGGTA